MISLRRFVLPVTLGGVAGAGAQLALSAVFPPLAPFVGGLLGGLVALALGRRARVAIGTLRLTTADALDHFAPGMLVQVSSYDGGNGQRTGEGDIRTHRGGN